MSSSMGQWLLPMVAREGVGGGGIVVRCVVTMRRLMRREEILRETILGGERGA